MWPNGAVVYRVKTYDQMIAKLARCTDQLTKWQLVKALTAQVSLGESSAINVNGVHVILHSMAREDGGGSSFNLEVGLNGVTYKCYCRTKD